MGLPQLIINFQTLATKFISRSENGIVAMLLKDDTLSDSLYTYYNYGDIKENWSDANKKYLEFVFRGNPKKVYIARIGATTPDLTTALQTLGNKQWDYMCYPEATTQEVTTIELWITGKRNTDKKTYKTVVPKKGSDHEGVIDFTTDNILIEGVTYNSNKYCARIAGLAAGVGVSSSLTNYSLPEVESITELSDDTARSAAIDNGELILVNNGTEYVIGRGVNSLKTTSTTKGQVFKKIRIIEIIDTIRDDITKAINEDYKGKVINTYNNKMLLVGAINAYFAILAKDNILDPEFNNNCSIDIGYQRIYLKGIGAKIDGLTDEQVARYNTNDQVFLTCNIKPTDAMEDFRIDIFI